MSFLLDSHTLLWALTDHQKLSPKVTAILEDPINDIFVSSVSLWEISLKYLLGKLDLNGSNPDEILNLAKETGFDFLPLLPTEAAGYHNLNAKFHKDPFDRMLMWQAIKNNLTLLSKDKSIAQYVTIGLKLIW